MANSSFSKGSLDDNSPMPYGIHKNTPLGAVPPKYLLNLYDKNKLDKKVRRYVADNFLALLAEQEQLTYCAKQKIQNSLDVPEVDPTYIREKSFSSNLLTSNII